MQAAPGTQAAGMQVADAVRTLGYGVVRGALPPSEVAALSANVAAELLRPSAPVMLESGTPALDLAAPSTWPSGTARRALEVTVPGSAAADTIWAAVPRAPKLRAALDALLGAGGWALPLNAPPREGAPREEFVRHWYCPVTFPEGAASAARSKGSRGGGTLAPPASDCCGKLWSAAEHEALAAAVVARAAAHRNFDAGWDAVAAAVSAAGGSAGARTKKMCRERWQPAWSDTEDARLLECVNALGGAHAPGKLFTAFHAAVEHSTRTRLQLQGRAAALASARAAAEAAAGAEGGGAHSSDPHREWTAINRRRVPHRGWHVDIGPGFDTASPRTAAGHEFQGLVVLVLLSDWAPGGGGTAVVTYSHRRVMERLASAGAAGIPHDELSRWTQDVTLAEIESGALRYVRGGDSAAGGAEPCIEQICGRAGDIALVHPLAVHSGTTNHCALPRLMANGMVRLAPGAFVQSGHPLLREMSSVKRMRSEGDAADSDEQSAGVAPLDAATGAAAAAGAASTASATAAALQQLRASLVSAESVAAMQRAAPNEALPVVSVIMPVHNAEAWLDESIGSILTQTYSGPIELSAYDDGSTDGSHASLQRWTSILEAHGVRSVLSWGLPNGGCGYAKNRAIEQCSGSFLCFLDADDIMLPERLRSQLAAAQRYPEALVGCSWERLPRNATEHYAAWANGLSADEMLLQQFRETTLQMPTWFISRAAFAKTGAFTQDGVTESLAEDLEWLLRHLERFDDAAGESSRARGAVASLEDLAADASQGAEADSDASANTALVRVGPAPLLLYRWIGSSASSRTTRRILLKVRASAFERRILSRPPWSAGFLIWGVGRDGRALFSALSAEARGRVRAFLDIDPKLVGTTYENHQIDAPRSAPVVAPGHALTKQQPLLPCVVAVAVRRSAEVSGEGELERNVATLGAAEGTTLWYFC